MENTVDKVVSSRSPQSKGKTGKKSPKNKNKKTDKVSTNPVNAVKQENKVWRVVSGVG